jgi:hypothetical protein
MRPVETKVKVGTAAATVAGALIWILQTFVFKSHQIDPTLESYIYILVPAAFTFVGGYLAKHTHVPAVPVQLSAVSVGTAPQGYWVPDQPVGIPPQLGGTVTQPPIHDAETGEVAQPPAV